MRSTAIYVADLVSFFRLSLRGMMTESEKPRLPKRHYFTLQQAANELNRFYGSKHEPQIIDADYLLHLAANRLIRLYVPTYDEMIISRSEQSFSDDVKETFEYATKILSSEYFHQPKFLLIDWKSLTDIEIYNKSNVYMFHDMLIDVEFLKYYNIKDPVSPHSCSCTETNSCATCKLLIKNLKNTYISLEEIMDEVRSEYENPYEYYVYEFKENELGRDSMEVTKDSLFIFLNDIERLTSGELLPLRDGYPPISSTIDSQSKNQVLHKPSTRERNNVAKIIAALVEMNGRSLSDRYTLAKELEIISEKLSSKVSDDTIVKWLDLAAEQTL